MQPAFVTLRLSLMMFLQFFIWGAWYVTAYLYLGDKIGFGGSEISWTYSVGPIAGMISPFLVGMIADRFFSTERILGLLHVLGGVAMFATIQVMESATGAEGEAATPSATLVNSLFFVHMLCYFPTLALTNSLALSNMTNAEKQFPLIRVFGTIGWIIAGLLVTLQSWDSDIKMFYLAAGAAILMGVYCFTLPHTPPPAKGQKVSLREIFGLDAFVLLKRPSFLTFMVCSFLICIPLAFYYQMASKFVDHSGQSGVAGLMSLGQMSEIFFMLVMPIFFARLGVKWMLFVGMLAWVARYGLFSAAADDGTTWMIIAGIVLHGICYDFFFVTGQIYTDRVAPNAIRGQAQGMLVLFTLGLGMFIGAQVAGQVENHFTIEANTETKAELALIDENMAAATKASDDLLGYTDQPTYVKWWRMVFPISLSAEETQKVTALQADLTTHRQARSKILESIVDWKSIWRLPAIAAAVIMVAFALVFYDKVQPAEEAATS